MISGIVITVLDKRELVTLFFSLICGTCLAYHYLFVLPLCVILLCVFIAFEIHSSQNIKTIKYGDNEKTTKLPKGPDNALVT